MAYKTASGIILRNPSEKAKRFARQMKKGYVSETGEKLSSTDMAFRAGYLQARQDSANAFKSKHPRYKRKTI